MRTALETQCSGNHDRNGKVDEDKWDVCYTPEGERYTICAHRVGNTYCGAVIMLGNGPAVICCGNERNHEGGVMS